jgi:hypothetical protein
MQLKALTLVQIAVLAALTILLAWHTISWHNDGMHAELYDAIGETLWDTTKAVGYYVGLMAACGLLLGTLAERITELGGYKVEKIDHFEGGEDSSPQE